MENSKPKISTTLLQLKSILPEMTVDDIASYTGFHPQSIRTTLRRYCLPYKRIRRRKNWGSED